MNGKEVYRTLKFCRITGASLSSVIAIAVVCLLAAIPAKANLVQNGSFETTDLVTPGGYFCQTGLTCVSNVADWSSTCNVLLFVFGGCGTNQTELSLLFPDTNGEAFNGGLGLGGTIPDSPDGGNFVAGDGEAGYSAPFYQTIDGLDPGSYYTLTFDQAAAQQDGSVGATSEQWEVTFGSSTQYSTLMNTPSQGFTPWNVQTMTFQATSTSEVLQFLAVGTPYGLPPVSLIDGISLVESPTPEPPSLYLACLVMGVLTSVAYARRKWRANHA